jgi:outer membrane lipoprotein-sorting protein
MIARNRSPIAIALFGAALLSLAGERSLRAQDAPVDLHADAAKRAKTAKDPKDAQKPSMSAAEAVAKANDYFNEARVMSADFVQIGPDGSRSEGQLYVARPGKMLFKFSPPAKLEIVADGRSVAVRDQKLGTQDLYFIGQTPLKFLLADNIDLAKDTKVKRVDIDENAVVIEIEDKATFGGAAEIALVFDPETFALKQWTVIDAQGFQTVVSLFNIDLVTKPDPALFHIDDSVAPGGGPRKH